MAATRQDLFHLCDFFGFDRGDFYRMINSRLYLDRKQPQSCSLTGPFIGAPYAVMLLEMLIAMGARNIIFVGWCGAVSEQVKIGDIIVPTSALIDEGTSRHYGTSDKNISHPSSKLVARIRQSLEGRQIVFRSGTIWTMDAVYRETRQQVEARRRDGILAVEMELSALFSASSFRRVDLAAILVASDELSMPKWKPGFKEERFIRGCRTACKMVTELCLTLIP